MSLLWAIPPVAMVAGTLVLLAQLREIDGATTELARELQRLGELRDAVAEVRSSAADARARARGVRLG